LTLQQYKVEVTRAILHKEYNIQTTMGPEHGKV